MNILNTFTRRSLAENRSRTLVTVVGIILSMSLFTAVIEGAYSGQQFLYRSEVALNGGWMLYYPDLTDAQAAELHSDSNVKRHTEWHRIGWAEIGSQNDSKPYLLLKAIDGNFTDLAAVHVTSGRMPENAGEILLPNHLASNGGVRKEPGDTLTLSLGRRTVDGEDAGEFTPYAVGRSERIADAVTAAYTVVGFYDRFDYALESFDCPGYTALTLGDGVSRDVLLELESAGKINAFEDRHPIDHSRHRDLIAFSGVLGEDNIGTMLYGFAAILVFLVSFGSVSLIYNSFAISVSERTRQFGILKSVGATKKQIRRSVLYEALVLGSIGIPVGLIVGCAGIGLTLYLLRDAFRAFIIPGAGTDVRMQLVLHPLALLISATVCLLTTLISASIPARRAMRIPAIDAIRQTGDITINAKKIKTSRLTERLFGFEGVMASKNFRRNRKRYRSTVVSLFLSVTLFISASSFCAYLTNAVDTMGGREDAADITYDTVGEDRPDPDVLLARLAAVNGVTEAVYYEERAFEAQTTVAMIDKSWLVEQETLGETQAEVELWVLPCLFLDDEAFRRMCAENSIDPEPYFDPEHPAGVIQNEVTGRTYNERGTRWASWKYFADDSFPLTLALVDVHEDGETVPAYVSSITVPAPLKTGCMGITENTLALYVPFSMKAALLPEEAEPYFTTFCFRAPNHAQTAADMEKLLSDMGLPAYRLDDHAADRESMRMVVLVVNVFAYGFIILISLIAAANVFNTISTSISLRRREFAMLKSIGLGEKGFMRMMNYECVIYGAKGLALGLPASALMTAMIWRIANSGVMGGFYVPWHSVVIAVGSVFAVVFATMLYAAGKIRQDNPIDALKNENL